MQNLSVPNRNHPHNTKLAQTAIVFRSDKHVHLKIMDASSQPRPPQAGATSTFRCSLALLRCLEVEQILLKRHTHTHNLQVIHTILEFHSRSTSRIYANSGLLPFSLTSLLQHLYFFGNSDYRAWGSVRERSNGSASDGPGCSGSGGCGSLPQDSCRRHL